MTLIHEFQQQFHASPTLLIRAPGRVNIIGEHTDYNRGFVLPMAIDRCVQIILRPRPDRQVVLHSMEYNETASFLLDELKKGDGWIEYIKGAAWAVGQKGWQPSGWEGVITGNVPRGAGLSSSSAVVVAAVLAFTSNSANARDILQVDPIQVALLGHEAEDGWVGVHGGIMDQMVSVLSRPGHALFLDCRSLETRQIPLPQRLSIAVLDTATRRGLVNSAYNERRQQCDTAAAALGVNALRDASMELLGSRAADLEQVTFRRARHVITENERVLLAVRAMEAADPERLGLLLNASHASLRTDFEVSNGELDAMVEIARRQPGCYGARMTGAGFGGCAIALLQQERGEEFSTAVTREYKQATGLDPAVHLCQPAEGAGILPLTI